MPRIEVDVPKAQFLEWVKRAQRAQTSVNRLIQQALAGVGRKTNPCGGARRRNPATLDKKFLAAARKIERDIAAHAKGEEHENTRRIYKAIDRLDDRASRPELRGSPERDQYLDIARDLRRSVRPAEEAAQTARTAGRQAEIKRLRDESRRAGYESVGDVGYGDKYRVGNPRARRRRNDFTPAMSPELARKQRKQLDREIRAHHKRTNLDKLARLRHDITAARQSSKRLRGEAVSLCRIGRTMTKERAKQIRIEGREAIRKAIEEEKLAAREACDGRKAKIREDITSAVARARAELKEEKRYQREIKRIESHAKKQARPMSTAAERRGESDDTVRDNIPADLVPLFEQVKRQIKGSDRETRTESFLRYAEENPGEVAAAIGREAEREIARLQREEAKEMRALRRRGVSAAELAAVPF